MKLNLLLLAFAGILVLTGCNTTRDIMNSYEEHLVAGRYASATEMTLERAEKKDSTQLMWRLLAGNSCMLDNKPSQSIEQLDLAEDLFQENDRQSVFSRVVSNTKAMLCNENSFDYNGLGQDRIFCCFYKGIDYAFMGNVVAARTEFNRAADHQENWLFERRKDIAAAEKRLADETANIPEDKRVKDQDTTKQTSEILGDDSFREQVKQKCGYDPGLSGNLDMLARDAYMNAYMEHFIGVFRWINGDGARGYFKDARDLCPQNEFVAQDFAEANALVQPQNTVWIYVEDGLCSKREEWRLDLPTLLIPYANRYVLYAGMALPYLVKRDVGADAYYVGPEGLPLHGLPELQDVDKLLKTEYDVYMSGALPREITRTLLKIGAQVALGIACESTNDNSARVALKLAQTGIATWAASSTAADVRCWSSLPKSVKMIRMERPADGKIMLVATNPSVQKETHLTLPEGNSIVWIRKVSRGADMIVKILTVPCAR